ncbi:MAG: SH3 domain-containing protein [Candidatus Brocadiia bacterium]
MNRISKAVVSLICLLLASYSLGFAGSYPCAGEVTGDKVNIRCGASKKFQSLKLLEKATKVTVLGEEGDYYLIKCPADVPVWISAKYITISGEFGVVNGNNVNLRSKPVTGDVVGSVSEPLKIRVIEKKDDWVKVEAPPTVKVYIVKEFVKLVPEAQPSKSPSPSPSASPTPAQPKPSEIAAADFDAANKAFKEELSKDKLDADFMKVLKMYQGVLADPYAASFYDECRKQVANCEFWIEYQRALREFKGKNDELQKKIEELQKELERKLKELADEKAKNHKNEEEVFQATGWIASIGMVINRPATHRLMQGDKVLYLLKSDTIKLDDYWGKFVGINGDVLPRPEGWEAEIIIVKQIKILDDRKRNPDKRK